MCLLRRTVVDRAAVGEEVPQPRRETLVCDEAMPHTEGHDDAESTGGSTECNADVDRWGREGEKGRRVEMRVERRGEENRTRRTRTDEDGRGGG